MRGRSLCLPWGVALAAALAPAVATAAEAPAPLDQRGRMVGVAAPASRVVTFNSVLWLYLTVEGGTRPIAGASASTVGTVTGGLLGRIFPDAARIPTRVAADGFFLPNVEEILRLRPDAVFQWAGRNDPAYLEPLDRVGLPVIGLRQTRAEADYFDTARLVGHVSGRPERVEALIERYRALYAELDRDLAALGPEPAPRVLFLWKRQPLVPIEGSNFFSRLIERSGGENVAAERRRPGAVSLETALAWNPQVILLFCCDRTTPDDLYRDPAWAAVAAIRDRRVYKIPAGGSRFADLVEGPLFSMWLAEILHPGLPRRLRDRFVETFRDVYGETLDESRLDATLHRAANRGSAGYERFFHP